jgi:hypothetical protein
VRFVNGLQRGILMKALRLRPPREADNFVNSICRQRKALATNAASIKKGGEN